METVDCLILKSGCHCDRIKEEHVATNNDTCSKNNYEVPLLPAVRSIKTMKPRQMSMLPSMRNLKNWTSKRLFFCGKRGLPDEDYIPSEESDLEFNHNTPARKSPRFHAVKEHNEGGTTVLKKGGNDYNEKKKSDNGKTITKHNKYLDQKSDDGGEDSNPTKKVCRIN